MAANERRLFIADTSFPGRGFQFRKNEQKLQIVKKTWFAAVKTYHLSIDLLIYFQSVAKSHLPKMLFHFKNYLCLLEKFFSLKTKGRIF
jgi:hypothetical protein